MRATSAWSGYLVLLQSSSSFYSHQLRSSSATWIITLPHPSVPCHVFGCSSQYVQDDIKLYVIASCSFFICLHPIFSTVLFCSSVCFLSSVLCPCTNHCRHQHLVGLRGSVMSSFIAVLIVVGRQSTCIIFNPPPCSSIHRPLPSVLSCARLFRSVWSR